MWGLTFGVWSAEFLQLESFETELSVPELAAKEGGPPCFRAVFIRAPAILEAGPDVEILASYSFPLGKPTMAGAALQEVSAIPIIIIIILHFLVVALSDGHAEIFFSAPRAHHKTLSVQFRAFIAPRIFVCADITAVLTDHPDVQRLVSIAYSSCGCPWIVSHPIFLMGWISILDCEKGACLACRGGNRLCSALIFWIGVYIVLKFVVSKLVLFLLLRLLQGFVNPEGKTLHFDLNLY